MFTRSDPNKQQYTDKKPMLTEWTDRTWFNNILRHLARKWSGSILTTLEPARGEIYLQ